MNYIYICGSYSALLFLCKLIFMEMKRNLGITETGL